MKELAAYSCRLHLIVKVVIIMKERAVDYCLCCVLVVTIFFVLSCVHEDF